VCYIVTYEIILFLTVAAVCLALSITHPFAINTLAAATTKAGKGDTPRSGTRQGLSQAHRNFGVPFPEKNVSDWEMHIHSKHRMAFLHLIFAIGCSRQISMCIMVVARIEQESAD
jgi:hypothetical protein